MEGRRTRARTWPSYPYPCENIKIGVPPLLYLKYAPGASRKTLYSTNISSPLAATLPLSLPTSISRYCSPLSIVTRTPGFASASSSSRLLSASSLAAMISA